MGHHHCMVPSRKANHGNMPLEYAKMSRSTDKSPPTANSPSASPNRGSGNSMRLFNLNTILFLCVFGCGYYQFSVFFGYDG